MRKAISLIVMIILAMFICQPTFAWEYGSGWSEQDLTVPGELKFQASIYASGHSSGATTLVSQVTPLTSAHIAFGLIRLENGSPGEHVLPAGVTGKTIIIELIADGTYVLGADTKTGWAIIALYDARDRIMLTWLDDTTGWVIANNDGCTITY